MKELVPRKFIREKLERGNHRKFCPSKISSYMVLIFACQIPSGILRDKREVDILASFQVKENNLSTIVISG